MSLLEAERIAKEWLLNSGVVEHSESWDLQYKELVKIVWMNSYKKAA